jgi:hypothetical protein
MNDKKVSSKQEEASNELNTKQKARRRVSDEQK